MDDISGSARHGVCANKNWDLMEVMVVRAVAIFNDRLLLLCGGYFQGYVVIV
jgi:hypothetical protein